MHCAASEGVRLTVRGLTFSAGKQLLLNRASFTLAPASATCLVGPNGSGKTSLLNVLTGFTRPSSGAIMLDDFELTGLPPHRIARLGIARTFQDPRLVGQFTVRENVRFAMADERESLPWALVPLRSFRTKAREREERVEELLEAFLLVEASEQIASTISFGQQKLTSLACCVATGARCLLLDEPAAGLSSRHRDQIADRIKTLKESGKTILFIEHHAGFLASVADHKLQIADGSVCSIS